MTIDEITMEGVRQKLFTDFQDSCRRFGGEFKKTDIEAVCDIIDKRMVISLKLPKDTLYGSFKIETYDGKKFGVIMDYRTVNVI